MENIIEVKDLTKKYNGFTAVDKINFEVKTGETFGILGPNGAGKTTTLEMIEGLKSITSGQVILDGKDVSKETFAVKSIIGVQLQASSFFEGLNLIELLDTFAALYNRKVNAVDLLKLVQLEEKSEAQVKELSGGQKQRMSIAVALVNHPNIFFLDEPTTALHPHPLPNLWDLVTHINKQGKTIVITTHYMDEAEVLCDRIAVMDHAKIIAMDTTENLLKLPGLNSSIVFGTTQQVDLEALKQLSGVISVEPENHSYRLETSDAQNTVTSLIALAQRSGFKMIDLQLHQPTLEDVFLKLTGHALRD